MKQFELELCYGNVWESQYFPVSGLTLKYLANKINTFEQEFKQK